jgi:lysophospholipase L1-like esterase
MRLTLMTVLLGSLMTFTAVAQTEQPKPDNDPYYAQFHELKAPAPFRHFLKPDDRLAICGDSITEQRKYSRIMETYITVCLPEMDVQVRQYGWSGEKVPGFLGRMTNDCLRFKPTIATTCYGMNDYEYRPYEDRIGKTYEDSTVTMVESFKTHGARVDLGSPGCMGKKPFWSKAQDASLDTLNESLGKLRNIDIEIAKKERVDFADVFWPMLVASHQAQAKYGTNYALCGKDGVHPDWAGHLVMAYAFLHSLGLDGDIGTFTVDMRSKKAKVSAGHELIGFKNGELTVRSHRYPFCIGDGDPAKPDNILSGTMLVPFNQDLNRLMLVMKHPQAKAYVITWGTATKTFPADELTKGINLAEQFGVNPFTDAFNKVDEAVAAKQAYETKEMKEIMHSAEAQKDMDGTVAAAEQEHKQLVDALKASFVPVTHTITIVAAQ